MLLDEVISIMVCFTMDLSIFATSSLLGISEHTIQSDEWGGCARLHKDGWIHQTLSSTGEVVEIDESLQFKRKGNVG